MMAHIIKLTNDLRYPVKQINGCRCIGPVIGLGDFNPRKGSEVFVGKLPSDCFEDELLPFFSRVGLVYNIRLMLNFVGETRQFCFVRYYNVANAKQAISVLNGAFIRPGHPLVVTESTDHRSIVLLDIQSNAVSSVEEVHQVLQNPELCVKDLQEIIPLSMGLCPAFRLNFSSHRGAAVTKRNYQIKYIPQHWGRYVRMIWEPNTAVEMRLQMKKERESAKKKGGWISKS